MAPSILKQVKDKGFLVLGHRDAIFGEENLLPHPRRPAEIQPRALPRQRIVYVDRHPAVEFMVRTLLGTKSPRKVAHIYSGCIYSPHSRLYFSDIGLHG